MLGQGRKYSKSGGKSILLAVRRDFHKAVYKDIYHLRA